MLLTSGLVSITFRKLVPEEIVSLMEQAGLRSIEWGGDVHCPHGDTGTAKRVGQLTRDAGLEVAAYGSYYRAGAAGGPSIEAVLDSASELGAPLIRVWAGNKGSADATKEDRAKVVDACRRIATEAAARDIQIAAEYHGGTLTDTPDSADALFAEVNHPNFLSLWQPNVGANAEFIEDSLERITPVLTNVHVFHWHPYNERQPLADGAGKWAPIITMLKSQGIRRHCLIEFVKGEAPAQLIEDAATLNAWLRD